MRHTSGADSAPRRLQIRGRLADTRTHVPTAWNNWTSAVIGQVFPSLRILDRARTQLAYLGLPGFGEPPGTGFESLAPGFETYDAFLAARYQAEGLNGLATVVWEMDAATLRPTFTSRNIEAVFGHPCECWVQDRDFWVKRLHPEDRSRALEACTRAIALRRSCTLEYRMLRADGRAVWIRDLVSFATGPEGRDLLRGVMLDITEGREAEEALNRRIATLETEVAAVTQTPPSNGRC